METHFCLSPFVCFALIYLSFFLSLSGSRWLDGSVFAFPPGLREEFEMDSRLRKIESKLSMLQQNTNFFIEMLHNQKRSERPARLLCFSLP